MARASLADLKAKHIAGSGHWGDQLSYRDRSALEQLLDDYKVGKASRHDVIARVDDLVTDAAQVAAQGERSAGEDYWRRYFISALEAA